MTSHPIVTLDGVAKRYGAFVALQETDLAIAEGEFVTLLGPSGCGKTTTLRLIGGFEQASAGRIAIAGQTMTETPPYRRPVNTVFQDYALFPHMSVAENIGYGLAVKSGRVGKAERDRRVADALAMVGLEGKAGMRPGALSGGQRQRVAMARAIVRRPRVLLLDEPLSALDVKLREGMQVELKRLHRELGITFLMVTHDQNEALALSDRIVVMNQGRIAQVGSPTDLYDRPASPYIADFIGGANLVDAEALGGGAFQLAGGQILHSRRGEVATLAASRHASLGLRAEHLHIAATGAENALACTVMERLFHGDRLRVELLPEGAEKPIFAELARTVVPAELAPGNRVTIGIDAAEVLVFPAEGRQ